ncbi:MAG: SCO family protein [Limisphaerales bacterium]
MKAKWVLTLLGALTLSAILCVFVFMRGGPSSHVKTVPTQTFQVRGQIRGLDMANRVIRIAHEEIPDYMPAMTMPLPVKDTALFKGLSKGDSVQFELTVTEGDSWISHIQKILSEASAAIANPATSADYIRTNEIERVQIGETVPDFKLVDQDGNDIRLRDLRGKVVVLTFIYTRCPLPNFCPLMSKNFADLERRLSKDFPNRYQLLSITMDPGFDRPSVLKEYAARYDANTKNWSFATGDLQQIQFIAGLTGLYYVWEGGLISHDLRTVLIGPDGRLAHIWRSNVWTPYEVQRFVAELLAPNKRNQPVQLRPPAVPTGVRKSA